MHVKVTNKGDGLLFLNPDKKSFSVKAGDTAVVLGGPYGESLIGDGYAIKMEAPPAPSSTPVNVVTDNRPEADVVAELAEVEGIGKATAKKLYAAGIQSIAGLINIDPVELARALDVTEGKAKSWQEAANQLLEDGE